MRSHCSCRGSAYLPLVFRRDTIAAFRKACSMAVWKVSNIEGPADLWTSVIIPAHSFSPLNLFDQSFCRPLKRSNFSWTDLFRPEVTLYGWRGVKIQELSSHLSVNHTGKYPILKLRVKDSFPGKPTVCITMVETLDCMPQFLLFLIKESDLFLPLGTRVRWLHFPHLETKAMGLQ